MGILEFFFITKEKVGHFFCGMCERENWKEEKEKKRIFLKLVTKQKGWSSDIIDIEKKSNRFFFFFVVVVVVCRELKQTKTKGRSLKI